MNALKHAGGSPRSVRSMGFSPMGMLLAAKNWLFSLTLGDLGRGVLLLFVFSLPLLYDLSVPEVSGDIRWTSTTFAAGLMVFLGLLFWWKNKGLPVSFRWPLTFWLALGLAIWAAVSMVDSLDWYRGIVMIKALYAQLILMVAAYLVWKPGFARSLLWAMVLPVAFTSWLGICQFMDWHDASFAALLSSFPVLGHTLSWVWGKIGFIDAITGYYQQSAVPGSTFANKNLAGSWTGMMLPLVVYLLVVSKSRRSKAIASFLLAIGMLFLVYARARASWVAMLAAILVMVTLMLAVPAWRKELFAKLHWKWVGWLAPMVVFLVLFGNAVSPVKGAHSVGDTPGYQVQTLAQAQWDDIGGRVAYNLNSLAIIKDYWFNGVGIGAFYTIYPAYYRALVVTPQNSYSVMARPQRSHTDLIEAFDEMGIPGGLLYAGVLLSALFMALRMGNPLSVQKVGLFPLFGGMSLFTISVNALMDFPMQLPTAPALACILIGILAAHYKVVFPKSFVGFRLAFRLPRWALLGALPAFLAVWSVAMYDHYLFRVSNQILKQAMIRVMSGISDDETLRLVETAYAVYPLDPRVHEYMGVAYANYKGSLNIPLETRIEKLEWVVKYDPWGANHLINLAGLYLTQAQMNFEQKRPELAKPALARVEELYARLQRVGDGSFYTWGIGGMLRLMQGKPDEAIPLFQRSLSIDPTYAPAQAGLQRAVQMAGRLPISTDAGKVDVSLPK